MYIISDISRKHTDRFMSSFMIQPNTQVGVIANVSHKHIYRFMLGFFFTFRLNAQTGLCYLPCFNQTHGQVYFSSDDLHRRTDRFMISSMFQPNEKDRFSLSSTFQPNGRKIYFIFQISTKRTDSFILYSMSQPNAQTGLCYLG